jgi:hypothetical protein
MVELEVLRCGDTSLAAYLREMWLARPASDLSIMNRLDRLVGAIDADNVP